MAHHDRAGNAQAGLDIPELAVAVRRGRHVGGSGIQALARVRQFASGHGLLGY